MNKNIEHILQSIEKDFIGTDNPYWNISREVGMFLHSLVRLSSAKHVLEIGTSIGYSGLFFADALRMTGGTLTTVESHDERFSLAHTHFEHAGVSDIVHQIKGHAPEVLVDIQGTCDMVFFDATKYEHVSYIKAIENKLSATAVVLADNCISHADEMRPYITYMREHQNFESVILPLGTGLLMSVYSLSSCPT